MNWECPVCGYNAGNELAKQTHLATQMNDDTHKAFNKGKSYMDEIRKRVNEGLSKSKDQGESLKDKIF